MSRLAAHEEVSAEPAARRHRASIGHLRVKIVPPRGEREALKAGRCRHRRVVERGRKHRRKSPADDAQRLRHAETKAVPAAQQTALRQVEGVGVTLKLARAEPCLSTPRRDAHAPPVAKLAPRFEIEEQARRPAPAKSPAEPHLMPVEAAYPARQPSSAKALVDRHRHQSCPRIRLARG